MQFCNAVSSRPQKATSLSFRTQVGSIPTRGSKHLHCNFLHSLGYHPDIFGHPMKTFIGTEVMMPKWSRRWPARLVLVGSSPTVTSNLLVC